MEQSASTALPWTCPFCGRRVPRRVNECRCGFQQAGAPAEDAAPPVETSTPRGSSRWSLVIFGVLVLAGAGLYIAQSQTAPETSAGQTPRVTTAAPPSPATPNA